MSREDEYKIMRIRDVDADSFVAVVKLMPGHFPEVWDVVNRFPYSDRGITRAHEYICEVTSRQHDLWKYPQ